MADTTTEQCPNCGCLTTGKKESHGAMGAGGGTVVGGMTFGPVGAVIGGITGALLGHSDEYHFYCEKCGHSWTK